MSDDTIDVRIRSHFDKGGTDAAAKGLQGVDKATIAAQKSAAQSARAIAQLDQAFSKSAVSATKAAQADAKLATDLARLDASQSRAALSALQLAQAQERAARQTKELANGFQVLPRTLERFGQGAVSQFKQVGSALAGAFAVQQIASFSAETVSLANRTNDAKTALNALAGSPKLYAEALAVAEAQQRKFGGSLQENISGVQGLITVSRSSGIELAKLIDITQRLSIKDPAQGIAGARIALNEALSGDPTSLAKRYEIPKAALAAIRDESTSTAEKLQILDTYLNQIGITSEVASGGISKQTQSFNALGASAEKTQVALGTLISTAVAPWADALAGALQGVASGLESFGQIGAQQANLNAQLVAGTASYQAYQQGLAGVNQEITSQSTLVTGMVARLPELTEQQFALAQALMAQGASSQQAVAAVSTYGQALSQLTGPQREFVAGLVAQGQSLEQAIAATQPLAASLGVVSAAQQELVGTGQLSAEAAQTLTDRMGALAAVGGPVEATIAAIADGMLMGTITAEQAAAAVGQLERAQLAEANAAAFAAQRAEERAMGSQMAAQAADTNAASLVEETAKQLESAAAAQELAAFQQALASISGAVVAGHMSAGDAALALAARYGIASGEAERLLALQAQVARTAGVRAVAGIGGSIIGKTVGLIKNATAANEALADRTRQTGTATQRAAQLQADYNNAVAKYGVGSAQAIAAETAIIAARQKSAAASSKAGGAAASRANAEAAASDKIIDLAEATAAKLEEIDRKSAERRAQAAQNLANTIRETSADLLASQEANDLSIVGETDEGRLADIRAREEAEAQARIATIEAISEARRIADEGDAELAQDVLDQRSEAIQKQQALDEEYNKKKAEFADNPELMAALQKEYDEATAAAEAATQVRIDLAKQEADQRIASLAAEKQAVLDDANARAAAMDSTGKNAATAQQRVDDLAAALRNIPTAVTTTVTVNEVRRGGGSSGESSSSGGSPSTANAAAGGGSFLTKGPTTLTVGDNPGGVEHVQVTPLSGKGQTRVGSGMIALAGGGSVVGGAADSAIDALKNAPGAAIPAAAKVAGKGGGGGGGSSGESAKDALAEAKAAIDLLDAMAELREKLASIGPPLNMDLVNQLAGEALEAAKALGAKFTLLSKEQADNFEIFTDTIGNAISALSDAASLRGDLLDIGPPMDMATVARLAYEAEQALYSIDRLLRPVAEAQAEAIERFTDASSSAIGLLSDAAGLREEAKEIGPPLDPVVMARLASEARSAFDIIQNTLLPISEEQADAVGRYADAAGASIGLLADVMNLSAERFADYRSPSDAQISMFVSDTQRIVKAVDTAAALFKTEGLEAAKTWAETSGAVYGTIQEGLVTADKLRFGDPTIDPAQLQKYVDGTVLVLDAVDSLAARAAAVDMGGIGNLGAIASTVGDSTAMLAALASVPSFGGGGGGSTTTNTTNSPVFNLTFVQQPGQNMNQFADAVIGRIQRQWSGHR